MNKIKRILPYFVITLFCLMGLVGNVASAQTLPDELWDKVADKIVERILGNSQVENVEDMLGWSTKDEIWLNNDSGVIYFDTSKGSGIRVNSGTMQCKNSGGSWAACSGGTPGDEGWLANTSGTNLLMYPATAADGSQYRLVIGGTATTTSNSQFEVIGASVMDAITASGNVSVGGTLAVTGVATFSADPVFGGTTPLVTIGDAGAEDAGILLDGNAQDFYIALDDTADDLLIGLGSAIGTTPAISITEDLDVTLAADLAITGTTTMTLGLVVDTNTLITDVANNRVGIGVSDPSNALEVLATAAQVKLSYDGTNYITMAVQSDGDITFDSNKTNFDTDWGDSNLTTTGNLSAANYTVTGTLTGTGDLIWDTNILYVDVSENSVGIGTTTPNDRGASLSVYDEIEIFDATSPYDVLHEFTDSSDDGVYNQYADGSITNVFHGNGSSYFTAGNLGIGTTTPDCGLTVGDTVPSTACSGDDDVMITGTLEVDGAVDFDGAINIAGVLTQVGVANFTTANVTMGTTDFVFDAANSKIGLGTTSPDCMLSIGVNVPSTACAGVDDAFISGTLEVDGALNFDGAADFASTLAVTSHVTFDTDTFYLNATSDEVAIGTTTTDQEFAVVGGSTGTTTISIGDQISATAGSCIELTTAGTEYRLYVNSSGTLTTEAGSCE